MNLLSVLLVKKGESIRVWKCRIAAWLLIILKRIIKLSYSICFSKESHSKSSNIIEILQSLAKSLNTNLAAFRWIISIEWILHWVWGDKTVAAYFIIGQTYVIKVSGLMRSTAFKRRPTFSFTVIVSALKTFYYY